MRKPPLAIRSRTASALAFLVILSCGRLSAQAPVDFPLTLPTADKPAPAFEYDKSSRVLVLGYHRFANKPADSLSTTGAELRQQIADIRDAGFEFITLEKFQAWEAG